MPTEEGRKGCFFMVSKEFKFPLNKNGSHKYSWREARGQTDKSSFR